MYWDYTLIGIEFVCLALMIGWMFITSHTHYAIRAIAAVIVVILSIHIWTEAVGFRGYAVPGKPPENSAIIGFSASSEEGYLYLWVQEKKGPRVYETPYNEKLIKDLFKAMKLTEGTSNQIIYRSVGEDVEIDVKSVLPPKHRE